MNHLGHIAFFRARPSALVAVVGLIAFGSVQGAQSPLVTRFDGGSNDQGNAISVDQFGSTYVGGEVGNSSSMPEFTVIKYDVAGAQQWTAKYLDATHGIDAGAVRSIAIDGSGNIYAVGYVYKIVSAFAVDMDWLVVSYSPAGVERWSQRIGGTAHDRDFAQDVVVDRVGNIYVSGTVKDTLPTGTAGWTIIKYASDGTVLWRQTDVRNDGRFDGFANPRLDADGNLVGVGHNVAVQTDGQHKIVATKVDSNGKVIWRSLYSDTPTSDDVLTDMDMDASGNIYITGETVASTNPELEHVPITVKFDGSGNLKYVLRGDGAGGTSVVVDRVGDIVVSGTSLRESGITGLVATSKYDAAGNRKWLAAGVDGLLGTDQAGNVYAFSSPQQFGSSDSADLITTKLNVNGAIVWQDRVNGSLSTTEASRDAAVAMAIDPFDNVVEVGNAQSGAKSDILVLRYAANTTPLPPSTSVNAPSALKASATSGRVTLSWIDNSSNETAFSVERCQNKGCVDFAPLTQVATNVTRYIDSSVTKNTTYQYRVRALNGTSVSSYSNTAVSTTPRK